MLNFYDQTRTDQMDKPCSAYGKRVYSARLQESEEDYKYQENSGYIIWKVTLEGKVSESGKEMRNRERGVEEGLNLRPELYMGYSAKR